MALEEGCALYDYDASDEDELSFKKGDSLFVLEMYDDGWWLVEKEHETGLAPSNYIAVVDNDGNDSDRANVADEAPFPVTTPPPQNLPKGWKAAFDESSKDFYFYNESTGEVQWENPRDNADNDSLRYRQSVSAYDSDSTSDLLDGLSPTELKRLKVLREEADTKLNAMRAAVASLESGELHAETHHHDKIRVSVASKAQPLGTNPEEGKTSMTVRSSKGKVVTAKEGGIPQVRLDSSSVGTISKLVDERLRREFAARDQRLIEQMKALLSQQTSRGAGAIDSSNYEDGGGGDQENKRKNHKKGSATRVSAKIQRRLNANEAAAGKGGALLSSRSGGHDRHRSCSSSRSWEDDTEHFNDNDDDDGLLLVDQSLLHSSRKVTSAGAPVGHQHKRPTENPALVLPVVQLPPDPVHRSMDIHRNRIKNSEINLPGIVHGGAGVETLQDEGLAEQLLPIAPASSSPVKSSKLPSLNGKRPNKYGNLVSSSSCRSRTPATAAGDGGAGAGVGGAVSEDGAFHYSQCRSAIYPPAAERTPTAPSAIPAVSLRLHHVFGYDGDFSKHGGSIRGKNILMDRFGRLIFPAAALVVLMDVNQKTLSDKRVDEVPSHLKQAFFCGHSEDVTSLAMHPNRGIIASGQMGKEGPVLVWDTSIPSGHSSSSEGSSSSAVCATLKLTAANTRGVAGLSFSGDGKFLAVLAIDESHSVVVFDWKEGLMIAAAKLGHIEVYGIKFHNLSTTQVFASSYQQERNGADVSSESNTGESCYSLVSFGGRHIKFWTLKETPVDEAIAIQEISSFKGRKLSVKKKDSSRKGGGARAGGSGSAYPVKSTFRLEGNLGTISSHKGNIVGANPSSGDYTCITFVDDNDPSVRETNDEAVLCSGFKSRVFAGTSNGTVFIWRQLFGEDNHTAAAHPPHPRGGAVQGAVLRAGSSLREARWLPRGKLLSVVTDVHDSPLVDMDYINYTASSIYTGASATPPTARFFDKIISCSSDGVINVWKVGRHLEARGNDDAAGIQQQQQPLPLEHLEMIEIAASEHARALCWDLSGQHAYIGCMDNSIQKISRYGDGPPGLSSQNHHDHYHHHQKQRGEDEDENNKPQELQQQEDLPPSDVTPILRSHHAKVRRIAVNPIVSSIFASISSDRSIRLWDATISQQLSVTRVREPASCIAFAPDGLTAAVGTELGDIIIYGNDFLEKLFSGNFERTALHKTRDVSVYPDGEVKWRVIYHKKLVPSSKTGHTAEASGRGAGGAQQGNSNNSSKQQRKHEIVEIVFSPSGRILAVGCRDNLIHILAADNNFKKIAVCRGHTSFVRNMDFSKDGRVIQSTDGARELLFWDVSSGQRITNASMYRNLAWHTHSCIYGWAVQGVFNGVPGIAAASVDGEVHCVDRSPDGDLMVAGTSHTVSHAIKLLNYPCLSDAVPSLHGGHSSPVLDIAFISTPEAAGVDDGCAHVEYDEYRLKPKVHGNKADGEAGRGMGREGGGEEGEVLGVISAGGNDACLFQWKVVYNDMSSAGPRQNAPVQVEAPSHMHRQFGY